MQDSQVPAGDTSGRIPFISPVLHCIAMTGVVFLRSSFGYIYLRHKAIFISLGYAQVLYSIYVWCEPGVWAKHHAEVIFGTSAFALYLIHLATAVGRGIAETGNRDKYSGKSHLLRFVPIHHENAEMIVHLWIEPALILSVALVLGIVFSESGLAHWLIIVAFALCLKEMTNYWHRLRVRKRAKDAWEEAQERFEDYAADAPPERRTKPTRKPKMKPMRVTNVPERRYADLLNLHPPYTLEDAARNFRELIKECHPDTNQETAENAERARQLNEALEYFRQKLVN